MKFGVKIVSVFSYFTDIKFSNNGDIANFPYKEFIHSLAKIYNKEFFLLLIFENLSI